MTPNNQNYSDLLNALSLILAVENLSENRQQSQYNDVQSANDRQAEYLLNEINNRFAEQNDILREHTALLTEILEILRKESEVYNGNEKEYGGNHSHD